MLSRSMLISTLESCVGEVMAISSRRRVFCKHMGSLDSICSKLKFHKAQILTARIFNDCLLLEPLAVVWSTSSAVPLIAGTSVSSVGSREVLRNLMIKFSGEGSGLNLLKCLSSRLGSSRNSNQSTVSGLAGTVPGLSNSTSISGGTGVLYVH